MNTTEVVRFQRDWETERGIYEYNSVLFGMMRAYDEYLEAMQEYATGDRHAMLEEVADVVIFLHSVAMHIMDEAGLPENAFEQVIESKMLRNHAKYDEAFFNNGWPVSEAIVTARHWHKYDLHRKLGEPNDYY